MTPCTLSPDLAAALAALTTGHESDAPRDSHGLAAALGWTQGKAAAALGRLNSRGLVTCDNGPDGRTWARYDSAAPGLPGMAREALEAAETVRPVPAQVEALETFGPDLADGCHGLARKADAPRKAESHFMAREAAQDAAARGQYRRAAALLREARPWIAGHGRRERLEIEAAEMERKADALEARPAAREALARVADGLARVDLDSVADKVEADAQERAQVPAKRAADIGLGAMVREAVAAPQAAQERPQVPAYGDTLPNGCRVLGVALGAAFGRVYVMAETLGRAGHPFATWSLEPGTWATHWGTYHETAQAAAATLTERAANN